MKLFTSILALTCLLNVAAAQNSEKTVTPDKSSAASSTRSKPLTPKSAMPAQRKPSAPALANNSNNSKMSAELSRLERGDKLASSPQKKTAAKVPPVKSPSSEHSPPINATYKKPSTSRTVKISGR